MQTIPDDRLNAVIVVRLDAATVKTLCVRSHTNTTIEWNLSRGLFVRGQNPKTFLTFNGTGKVNTLLFVTTTYTPTKDRFVYLQHNLCSSLDRKLWISTNESSNCTTAKCFNGFLNLLISVFFFFLWWKWSKQIGESNRFFSIEIKSLNNWNLISGFYSNVWHLTRS